MKYGYINSSFKHNLRRIRTVQLLLVFITVITLTACDNQPKLQPLDNEATILAFGDSLTYGTGAGVNKSYPAVLQQRTGLNVINAGIPGEVSAAGKARLPQLLQRYQPDLVILCHGGNDILRKKDLALAKQNIQAMISLAQQSGAQVMLVGVPEFGLFLDDSAMYEELATENNIPIQAGILGDILRQNKFKADHVHPNAQGYQLLAESILETLTQSGALQKPPE